MDIHPYYQRGTNALPGVEYGWIKMADGAAAYAKKADGKLWTADAHAALFRRLGIPFGGYEFAEPANAHLGAQAFDALWAECLRLGGTGVAPGVDIEGEGWNKTNATQRGKAFCQRARARGVRPAIYMDLSLLQACRPDLWPENPVIWAPRYGAAPQVGGRYTGRYDVHQYTSSGSLPGSAGAVDWNQSYSAGKTPGTAHLLAATPEEDMSLNPDDKAAIRAIVQDVMRYGVLATAHPGDLNRATGQPYAVDDPAVFVFGGTPDAPGGRNPMDILMDTRNRAEAMQAALTDIALRVAEQQGVPVADLVAGVVAGLLPDIKAQLTDVQHIDEDAVAVKLDQLIAARFAQ